MLESLIPNNYLRAFIILVVFLLVIRVILLLLEKFTLKITSKTKTDLDDFLVKRSSKPLTFLAFLISLIVSIKEITMTQAVGSAISSLIYSLMVIVVAYLIYVVIDVLVIRAVKKVTKKTKSEIDDSLVSLFHSVLKICLFVIALLYILSLWGVEITPLLAGLGIAGLAVALALQPILSNIFSGAAIVMDHSVRVGDLVYLDKAKGKIEKIGLRSTRIRTFDNELAIIPNNKLADGVIQNVALPEPKSRAVISFGVAYGTNIDKVKKLIAKELKKIPHVVNDPAPIARFLEMGDSSLNFKAFFYVDSFDNRFAAIDDANTAIYNALNKAGIEIPFPQRDVHMKK
jgi:MscS family membrane protein